MSDFKLSDLKENVDRNNQRKKVTRIFIIFCVIFLVAAAAIGLISTRKKAVKVVTKEMDEFDLTCEYLDTSYGFYCALENDDTIAIYTDDTTGKIDYISFDIDVPGFKTKEEALSYATEKIHEYQEVIRSADPPINSIDMVEIEDPFYGFRQPFMEAEEVQDLSTSVTLPSGTEISVSYYADYNSFHYRVSNYKY